jgi:1,4-alpha-glucan branching enzyme
MATKSSQKSVKFAYTAPHAKSVAVAGTFNNWNPKSYPMKAGAKGHWSCSVKLSPGRYEYRFVVNGTQWVNDPVAKECCPNALGGQNCVLHV